MKAIRQFIAKFIPSPIVVDFEKGGGTSIQEVAPYPKEVFWDDSIPIHRSSSGWDYVQTPEERFENLPNYSFKPNYVVVDGLRMHYVDEGLKDGELILMLHGQPTWSFLYRKMIPILVEKGYRCIAPDMMGMGKSDKPISEKYHTYDRHCDNTMAFIQALDLKNIHAFIQDWGSVIGTRLVGEYPDLFASVVLANGDLPRFKKDTNPFYIPNPLVVNPRIKGLKSAMAKHVLLGLFNSFQAWLLYSLCNTRNFVGDVMQMTTENKLSDDILAAYEAPFPSFIFMAGPRTLPSMNAGIIGQQMQAWENFKDFHKPFLSLIGLKDNLLGRPSLQRKWVTHVPGAKGQPHEQFKNANHFIQEDIGEIMADRMHQFIECNK